MTGATGPRVHYCVAVATEGPWVIADAYLLDGDVLRVRIPASAFAGPLPERDEGVVVSIDGARVAASVGDPPAAESDAAAEREFLDWASKVHL